MSFQFGNRSTPYSCTPGQAPSNNGNNFNPNQQYASNYRGYSNNNNGCNSSQMYPQQYQQQYQQQFQQAYQQQQQQHHQQQRQQQQPQMQMPTPQMNVLPPGQAPDPNMKVIKLNWGDLLGQAGGANSAQGLKVAMVGANGDVNSGFPGLRCTFNGQVPQGMPVHVMQINPYANIGPQQQQQGR